MIFGSVIRRAEHAVENILDQALARVIVAIPLLVAAGFATASASAFFNTRYGAEMGNLILAGVFAFIGLVSAMVMAVRATGGPAEAPQQIPAAEVDHDGNTGEAPAAPFTTSEKELMNAMLTSAAPIALPGLIRLIMRNIPLVLALLAAVFVMTRTSGEANVPAAGETVAT